MKTIPISEVDFNDENIRIINFFGSYEIDYYGFYVHLTSDEICDVDMKNFCPYHLLYHGILLLELSETNRKNFKQMVYDSVFPRLDPFWIFVLNTIIIRYDMGIIISNKNFHGVPENILRHVKKIITVKKLKYHPTLEMNE